jgi:hypothetical protein
MRGTIPPLPQYAFMAWCLVKHRDNFNFTFYVHHVGETLHQFIMTTETTEKEREYVIILRKYTLATRV